MFDSHRQTHEAAALTLENIWQTVDGRNDVHFVFTVKDVSKAPTFLDAPASTRAGEEAGVVSGEYCFVTAATEIPA